MKNANIKDFVESAFDDLPEEPIIGLEDYIDREKENKLKKSKSICLWLKFFEEWFSILVSLKNVSVLGKKHPFFGTVLVPKEISAVQLLILLRDKLGEKITDETIASTKDIIAKRPKKESYIKYVRYKDYHGYLGSHRSGGFLPRIYGCNSIELILINLFEFYSTGKKINAFNGSLNDVIKKL